MKRLLFLSLTFIFINAYSQSFQGKVVDVSTGEALEYAHIGVVGKNIGGISLRNGEFTIDLSAAEKIDVVKISYIGYESFSVSVGSLDLTTQHTIKLQSKGYELNTVEVSATLQTKKLGNQKVGRTYTVGVILKVVEVESGACLLKELSAQLRLKRFHSE